MECGEKSEILIFQVCACPPVVENEACVVNGLRRSEDAAAADQSAALFLVEI